MIDEKIVEKVCEMSGLRKISVSKNPTWIDKNNQEGIEILNGKIESFWIKDMTRVYGEPATETIQKIINNIVIAMGGSSDNVEKGSTGNTAVVPMELTKLLIEKWSKMTTFERMLMFQTTPKEMIKYKPKGGKKVPYVEGNTMQMEANIAFLFQWSDEIDGFSSTEKSVSCYGSVSANIDGKKITHSAVGIDLQEFTKEDKKPVFTTEELMKNAHTDMIKKGLSKFGFNNDVYRGDV